MTPRHPSAQIRHVARLRLGLLLVVQEELHDVLHALRHRAAGMQHRALAVDDGAAARRPHGHVRRHLGALAGEVVRLAAREPLREVEDHGVLGLRVAGVAARAPAVEVRREVLARLVPRHQEARADAAEGATVGEAEIAEVVADWTGIPVTKLTADERKER